MWINYVKGYSQKSARVLAIGRGRFDKAQIAAAGITVLE
jgi:hypothetical protein